MADGDFTALAPWLAFMGMNAMERHPGVVGGNNNVLRLPFACI